MINTITFDVSNLFKIVVLACVSFATTLALLPISAVAQCSTGWDASGRWDIKQSNVESPIILTLQQNGRVLNGKAEATFVRKVTFHADIDYVTGTVDGTIDSDNLSIQIYWPNSKLLGNGKVGVYNAIVRPSGRLDGEAFEKSTPNVRYTWHSQGVLKCPPPPPPVTSEPPKSTGKAKPPKSTGKAKPEATEKQDEPAPQPLKPPAIVTTEVIYPDRRVPMGFVILQWDAGPDHPYAEVWFKVNGGEDTFLVEQGKGSRQVPVERGRQYTYILTDAGETLATVTFVAR